MSAIRLKTIDAHAAGEPLRLVVDGFPAPRGKTMLEKREWVKKHADHLRRALMLEPRGHADMYGAHPHRAGRARLARRRALHAQRGLQHDVRPRRHRGDDDCARARPDRAGRRRRDHRVRLARRDGSGARDAQGARARSGAAAARSAVESVAFTNVPSFVLHGGLTVKLGGAARFAPTSPSAAPSTPSSTAKRSGCRSTPRTCRSCGGSAWRSSTRSRRRTTIVHPLEPGLKGIYGTIFTGPPQRRARRSAQRDDLRGRRSRSLAVRARARRP